MDPKLPPLPTIRTTMPEDTNGCGEEIINEDRAWDFFFDSMRLECTIDHHHW
jgi:hypothetical protein